MSPAEKGEQLNVECSTNVVYGETSGFQLNKEKAIQSQNFLCGFCSHKSLTDWTAFFKP